MARLGKNRGKNLTRANAIIQGMQESEDVKPELPPVDGIPPQEITEETPPVETPPVEDIPPAETPPEGSAPPVETPPVEVTEEVIPEEPVAISDDLIYSRLSETLGREIKSYDDLKPAEVAVDPEVKQLLEWKEKTGLSLSKWNEFNKDFSKMGDLDVAKEILAQKYPSFTKEELAYSLKDYIFDEDTDDDDDKLKKSIELKKLSADGRKTLEQNRLDFIESKPTSSLTQEQTDLLAYANQMKEVENNTTALNDTHRSNLDLAAQNFVTLNLNLDEGVVIEHKIPDGEKKSLSKFVQEMPHWQNEDGTTNHAAIASDGYKIKNFDALLKAAYEQGKSTQADALHKASGNINLDGVVAPQGAGEEEKGNIQEVVNTITGKNSGSNFRFRKKNK